MIEEVGSVKEGSTNGSQPTNKRKRGRPPKDLQAIKPDDLRDIKQKRAQKLLKEALNQVCYDYHFVLLWYIYVTHMESSPSQSCNH